MCGDSGGIVVLRVKRTMSTHHSSTLKNVRMMHVFGELQQVLQFQNSENFAKLF